MKQQNSFTNEKGALYLVPTPIGNLEDMTFRAVRILQEADVVAAEDTRQTMKLFHHFDISSPLVSYHEHNKTMSGPKLIEEVKAGKNVALVSDAGMPAISDPGQELVREAINENLPVISLPGANAALTSLVASGLSTEAFQFIGFLPRQSKRRRERLEQLKKLDATLLFYESPHRIKEALEAMLNVFGNRKITICRELTKRYEEYQRGTLEEAMTWCETGKIKGEFCLVVEGANDIEEQEQWWERLTILEHVNHYIDAEKSSKDAIKLVAVERKIPKREVYAIYHQE
ncbi:16S rRNA (cytidine(1402)-2'-O)-methyltransferase [Bacillus suaedae]|uniref:Ribosomal RNA small subunit methyltransferase I n=1 Tax=Halalkalibacter suaedae TaxID=2822140 RepID=A0A941AR15_9BACI|nr:16S rRNA (cytidine(1402)-2'-O)-methyltransferase [Bacillus suaedae]MBP3953502.1 16S rRNA (cytidine(1402)-2'-O)-methyltransferase [Bacillus suaedae]